jgi:curved DNA-binding protein CbpA
MGMTDGSSPSAALTLLADVYREKRTGVLALGPEDSALRVAVRDGHVAGLVPDPGAAFATERPSSPDDSTRLKLERVLSEVGLRPRKAKPAPAREEAPAADLRESLLARLSDTVALARFEEKEDLPDVAPAAGATEPLILEAIRRVRDPDALRELLGDLDRRLVTTSSFAVEERTLTLTEGYILSRIDGQCTARQVLQLVPLDPEETERSLLGLILTGRVRSEPLPARVPPARRPAVEPGGEAAAPPPPPAEAESEPAHIPLGDDLADESAAVPPDAAAAPGEATTEATDSELQARRREILEVFQSLPLRNHFEVLGLEPGCSDAEVRRAHIAHVKLYHPDMQRDPRLADLHDVLEAIFIRIGEAWEVLGEPKSRAAYEARLGPRPPRAGAGASAPATAKTPAQESEEQLARMSPEDTLMLAQRLLRSQHYWDAIRVLEMALPRLQPQQNQSRGRILLARAYAHNPNWVRRAEETLQGLLREDPANADAHYELGRLYKGVGQVARAQALFKRAVQLRPDHSRAAAELGGGSGSPPPGGLLGRLFKKAKGS